MRAVGRRKADSGRGVSGVAEDLAAVCGAVGGVTPAETECPRVQMLLPWLANGELAQGDRLAAYQHLSSCPDCRRELGRYIELASVVTRAVDALPRPRSAVAEEMLARLSGAAVAGQAGQLSVSADLMLMRSLVGWARSAGMPGVALDPLEWALAMVAGA